MTAALTVTWGVLGLAVGAMLGPAAYWLADRPAPGHRPWLGAATATTFLLAAARCSSAYELLVYSMFAAIAIQLATVDLLARRLPRALIWPTCVAVTAILVADTIARHDTIQLLSASVAAVVVGGGYLAVALASRGGLGAGDVRLAVLVGGVLGWHSWTAVITGTTIGFIGTGALAVTRRIPTVIPHGPGMLAGAFVALLL